jgi:hypothetical protein
MLVVAAALGAPGAAAAAGIEYGSDVADDRRGEAHDDPRDPRNRRAPGIRPGRQSGPSTTRLR